MNSFPIIPVAQLPTRPICSDLLRQRVAWKTSKARKGREAERNILGQNRPEHEVGYFMACPSNTTSCAFFDPSSMGLLATTTVPIYQGLPIR